MFPEFARCARYSGVPDPTVTLHRKIIFPFSVNATGYASLIVAFNYVGDNSISTYCGIQLNNNSGYNGTNTTAGTQYYTSVALTNPYAIPANTIQSYRVVSAAAVVRCTEVITDQSGDIHAALVPLSCQNMATAYLNQADIVAASNLSGIQNVPNGRYVMAHAEQGQCARVIYVPANELFSQMVNPSTSAASGCYINTGGARDNYAVFIIEGSGDASTFELEYYLNLEVTSYPGSIISGMETITEEKGHYTGKWFDVFSQHSDLIATAYTGTMHGGNLAFTNLSQQQRYGQTYLNFANSQSMVKQGKFDIDWSKNGK